jgi:hypothetical protein
MWLIAVWILCLSALRQYLNLQPFASERACNSKRSDVLSEIWLKLDLYTLASEMYKCWFLIGTNSVLGLCIVESVLCSCVCIDDVDTCRSQSTFTERIWIVLLPLCLSTVWTSVYPCRRPVLADCNPQEGYTVHMDSPRGLHFCIHTSKGDWTPLFTNDNINFYSEILNASSMFEQYTISILLAVYVYFISRLLSYTSYTYFVLCFVVVLLL